MAIPDPSTPSRRDVLQTAALVGAGALVAQAAPVGPGAVPVKLAINGQVRELSLEPRVTLLDALREHLHLTGSKKGCDHGQCGACTVLVGGRRANACLMLAVMCEGESITTIEGLAQGDQLHAVQQAFIEHDAYQCGYCTPGQICSAVAAVGEMQRGDVSHATPHEVVAGGGAPGLADAEIQERMSGNLCRCGAYPNIVAAVRAVALLGGGPRRA